MRCKGCGYRLQDLPDERCPECGRTFDPNNPSTYTPDSGPPFPSRTVLRPSVCPVLFIFWFMTMSLVRFDEIASFVGLFVLAILAAVSIVMILRIVLTITSWMVHRRKFRD